MFSISGLQFGASKWLLSDSRSTVQTDRIDSEFLYSTWRYDTNVHANRTTLGCEETKSADGLHTPFEPK